MHPRDLQQPPHDPAYAVRRVLATAGITGAALALTAVAALPAAAAAAPGTGNAGTGPAPGNSDSAPGQTGSAGDSAAAPGHTGTAGSSSAASGPASQSTSPPGHSGTAPGQTGTAGNSGSAAGHTGSAQAHGGGNGSAGGDGNGGGNGHGNAGGNHPADGHNPPGNNGTVKVHDTSGDTSHHNVAHVGCSFAVDFWGFDAGQTMDVAFAGQAPTGAGTPVSFTAPQGTSLTSTDDAGGGNDYDGELSFQATPAQLSVLGAPQAQQGYHVRLTVATHQGGGHKYKVFWIDCAPTPAPGTVLPPTEGTLTGSTSTAGDTPTAPGTGTTTRAGGHIPVITDTPVSPQVKSAGEVLAFSTPVGNQASSPTLQAAPPVSSLPFTGAEIGGMVAAALAALGGGGAMLAIGRRRRRRSTA